VTDSEGTWLTPAALQKLIDEREQLTTVGRDAVVARIAEARAHGDLKENAEYDTAKNDQGLMEARIRQLNHLIENARIIDAVDDGAITVGTVATVIDDDGDEMEFFVAPAENKLPGMVLASPDSPLGAALMGATVGDTVTYKAPGGTFTCTVKAIRIHDS